MATQLDTEIMAATAAANEIAKHDEPAQSRREPTRINGGQGARRGGGTCQRGDRAHHARTDCGFAVLRDRCNAFRSREDALGAQVEQLATELVQIQSALTRVLALPGALSLEIQRATGADRAERDRVRAQLQRIIDEASAHGALNTVVEHIYHQAQRESTIGTLLLARANLSGVHVDRV